MASGLIDMSSYGRWAVGVEFNPSGNPKVHDVKVAAAALIDMIDAVGKDERTKALALTAVEEAAMWAVKSITKEPRA